MRTFFRVKETCATIVCDESLLRTAQEAIFEARAVIESKVEEDPFFGITYDPMPPDSSDHPLIQRMCQASVIAGVGPMAGVAGAVAEFAVGRLVDAGAEEAVVENGGDIAIYSPKGRPVGIFADHPVFRDLAFDVTADKVLGICSSSRKIGPSVSLGESNISTVVSDNVVLADCCATALGNMVTGEENLAESCERIGSLEGVRGCMSCCGGKIAVYGDLPEMIKADISRVL